MSTGDTHSSTFNGQGRQQRHPEEEPSNGYIPDTSSGAFLLPADAQGGFAFSAEPSMIDYSSMVSLTPSSGGAQETVFTPNTGSSFDSSLHPEYLTQSYPPPNFMQSYQNYALSPGMHSRSGHSISPSHSFDQLSPEAGYLNDPNHQDLSNYTSPNFTGQYLEEPFSNLNVVENNNTTNTGFHPTAFETFPQMPLPITPHVLATYNAQAHPPLPSHIRPDHTQLISPSPTNNSSPSIAQEASNHGNFSGMQHRRHQSQTCLLYTSPSPRDS